MDEMLEVLGETVPLDGGEILARRKALGLSLADLARLLDVEKRSLTRWEQGRKAVPLAFGVAVGEALDALEDLRDEMVDAMAATLEIGQELEGTGQVSLRVFRSDEEYWAADEEAAAARTPVGLHQVAAATAALALREEYDARVLLVTDPAPGTDGEGAVDDD